jgi:hypothetical protein
MGAFGDACAGQADARTGARNRAHSAGHTHRTAHRHPFARLLELLQQEGRDARRGDGDVVR